jgi:hypothetical protein
LSNVCIMVFMDKLKSQFKPQNNIQKLAFEKRGITSVTEFEKMLEPWDVKRTTARYWWDNGIKQPSLKNLAVLSDFLKVPLAELVREEK